MAERPARYVIIGNGAAGTTCAETLRKNDQECSITLLASEPYALYNRVSLPPFLKGQATEQKVMMRTPEAAERIRIDLRLNTCATSVDFVEKEVATCDGRILPYDRLLIATGGRPTPLDVPGADQYRCIYGFQTLDDTKAIIARAEQVTRAVTVGGSYISYELTDAFAIRRLNTTWLVRGPWFLRRVLDADGGQHIDSIARKAGVTTVYNEQVTEIIPNGNGTAMVVTNTGRQVETDMIACGLGLQYYVDFLRDTTIEINKAIVTNEYLETNIPDVYAAGDVAEFYDVTIDRHHTLGTWANAIAHGRLAAFNMLGARQAYVDIPVYTSTMFHTRMTAFGLTSDLHPGLEFICRAGPTEDDYRQLFFLDGRLVGGVMIGSAKGKAKLLQLIRGRQPIEGPREALFELA